MIALLTLLLTPVSAADPAEFWHTAEAAWLTGRTQLTLHGQFRWRFDTSADTKRTPRSAYYRGGPVVQAPWRGFVWQGGYYYQENHGRLTSDWEDSQRVFAGGEKQLSRGFSSRGMWEYFFGAARASFHRYRHHVRFVRERDGWSPLAYCELFVDRQGFFALRPYAGVRRNVGSSTRIEAGYFYDLRRRNVGGPRHVVFTSVRFQWRK